MGFFDRLKAGLTKTKNALVETITAVVHRRKIDDELFEELEETLIRADVGVNVAMELVEKLRKEARRRKVEHGEELVPILQELVQEALGTETAQLATNESGPTVVLVVGVNGVGKTTSIGKLAHYLKSQNKRVLLGAADTFRAAAIEQLQIWGQRAGVDVIHQGEGADPAAVSYDAVVAAKSRRSDVVMIDTAGRLHTKENLMEELKKIRRIVSRELPGAPHEVLLVLDATTGQNAVQQAKLFKETAGVTGIVLTKLDGTAKGGVVIAIAKGEQVPVKFIGVGEQLDDLQPFDPVAFAKALFEGAAPGEADEG